MGKLKIAVYAICKNEEQFVDRWIESMKEADLIVVADTGSTDNTVKKLREKGATVHKIKVDPWRFDIARNTSLHLVPNDVDVCVCTDLDELFEPGWRTKIENVWTKETTQLKYLYTWSFNPDGSRGVTFWYEKIHRRHGFRWIFPVHEVLEYCGEDNVVFAENKAIQLNHYPDTTKSRGQYLSLLELSVKEDPNNDRNMHYLGREYMYYQMWDDCIRTLKKHLELQSAHWKDERSASMRFIARSYKEKGNYQEAKSWLYKAIAEAPYLREPYVEMAQLAYEEEDWPGVYHMVEEALKIKEQPLTYINEAFAWDSTIYDLGSISCYHIGLLEKSLELAKIALEQSPNDERLKFNVEIIKTKISKRDQ